MIGIASAIASKAGGLFARFIGPKAVLALVAAAALAIWFLHSQLEAERQKATDRAVELSKAQEEIDDALEAYESEKALADQARTAAEHHVAVITHLADEVGRRAQVSADVDEQLKEADQDAPIEYRDCLRVPVPRAVSDLLWIGPRPADEGSRGEAGGGAREATGAADAAVPRDEPRDRRDRGLPRAGEGAG